MNIKFTAEQSFDVNVKRFYLNEEPTVLHCHFYTTLLTQLANDAAKFNGPKIMVSSTEETFYPVLIQYFKKHNITSQEDKARIIEQYYAYIGLGLMRIDIDKFSVELFHSHLDEAWLKNWTISDKPVNYITQGFIAVAFSAIIDSGIGAFKVQEIQSIACGSKTSKFIVEKIKGK